MQEFEKDCNAVSMKHNLLICAKGENKGGMYFDVDFADELSVTRLAEHIGVMQRSIEMTIIELDVLISKESGLDPGHFGSLVRKAYTDESLRYIIENKKFDPNNKPAEDDGAGGGQ